MKKFSIVLLLFFALSACSKQEPGLGDEESVFIKEHGESSQDYEQIIHMQYTQQFLGVDFSDGKASVIQLLFDPEANMAEASDEIKRRLPADIEEVNRDYYQDKLTIIEFTSESSEVSSIEVNLFGDKENDLYSMAYLIDKTSEK